MTDPTPEEQAAAMEQGREEAKQLAASGGEPVVAGRTWKEEAVLNTAKQGMTAQVEGAPFPLNLDGDTQLKLTREQAIELRDALTDWLNRSQVLTLTISEDGVKVGRRRKKR